MEAILIKNGWKIKGKLAEIMVQKNLAILVALEEETRVELSEGNPIVLDQKASEVKKQGRPKGTVKKDKNTIHKK